MPMKEAPGELVGIDLTVRLDDSAFALVEQLEWEQGIRWSDGRDQPSSPVSSVQSLSSPPPVAPAHVPDIEAGLDAEFNAAFGADPADPLPERHERISIKVDLRRRKPSRTVFADERAVVSALPDADLPRSKFWEGTSAPSASVHAAELPPLMPPLSSVNPDFDSMDWLSTVVWDETQAKQHRPMMTALLLNENDPNMIFAEGETAVAAESQRSDDVDLATRFNLSLDDSELYANAGVEERTVVGRAAVQHALFAQDLARPVYKSYFTEDELRWFHRPRARLDAAFISPRYTDKPRIVDSASARKYVPKKESEVSARDGRVILAEFVEEHPPLIANVGMASELVTYYRQKHSNDQTQPVVADGMVKVLSPEKDDESPFIADVRQGSSVMSMNNNMFAAPVFQHAISPTDFLLSRSPKRANWVIREVPALYTVGQIQPKVQVKTPNARDANAALKDMLSVFIYRLLRQNPKLLIADVFDAFPTQSETAIRAKLKEVADFQRGGHESGCWVLNQERAKLPSESAIREMVTPENMCEFASMRAGQHRLEMLGIEELLVWTPQLSTIISKLQPGLLKRQLEYIEEELQLTPWNLTSNFVSAVQGRCLLKLQGPGNPLGHGAGFSYIKAPHRFEADPTAPKIAPAKALTGTDKDLRKLNMQELFDALVFFGISEQEVKSLARWKRVALLRQLSSDATLNGEVTQFGRFARQQRNTNRVQHQRFLKEAQKIFDRQCEVLRCSVPPSLDDRSSEDEADELAADLEDMLDDRAASAPATADQEQAEYDKFMREQSSKAAAASQPPPPATDVQAMDVDEGKVVVAAPTQGPAPGVPSTKPKTIRRRIRRREVTRDLDGTEHERVTIIDDPAWVEAYLADKVDNGSRLKALEDALSSSAAAFNAATGTPPVADGSTTPMPVGKAGESAKSRIFRTKRDDMKSGRSRKRLLPGTTSGARSASRRMKEARAGAKPRAPRPSRPRPPRTPVLGPNGKPMVKCSSCRQFGHTKSNRKCPNHPDNLVLKVTDAESRVTLSLTKVPTPQRHAHGEKGTEHRRADGEPHQPTPKAHPPAAAKAASAPSTKKKRKRDRERSIAVVADGEAERCLKRRASFRRRGDPQITLNSFFNSALDATSDVIGVATFSKPVTDDIAPNYSTIVKKPMYIDLMKKKVRECAYTSRADFVADLELIESNSVAYNGPENFLTLHAKIVVDAAKRDLENNRAAVEETERHLVEYHELQALWARLGAIIETLWANPDSILFRFNVKKSEVPDYHQKIRSPVSLTSMKERLERSEYDSVKAFTHDLDLLVSNAVTYNGTGNPIADQAQRLRRLAYEQLDLSVPPA
ncbi:hypothetical protein PBRA_005155 [Plasmodiophora brassicae]|nr:hypothetical protein PBRA_005155 [Plasmodiophora brassicae]